MREALVEILENGLLDMMPISGRDFFDTDVFEALKSEEKIICYRQYYEDTPIENRLLRLKIWSNMGLTSYGSNHGLYKNGEGFEIIDLDKIKGTQTSNFLVLNYK